MVSFAVIGGLLLNIGAFLTYKGKIYESVIIFLLADLCWVIMAYERDDYLGVFFILVGVTFGLLAFVKMQTGKMRKSLNREKDDI
ncbi:hypothetical protein KKA17_12215 [bacterium]|nr:hypothetical protein [bacterium]MBU1884488.1 hypothetical protein [bacterium]